MKTPPSEIYGDGAWLQRMRVSDAGDLYRIVRHPKVARWTHLPRPYPAGEIEAVKIVRVL